MPECVLLDRINQAAARFMDLGRAVLAHTLWFTIWPASDFRTWKPASLLNEIEKRLNTVQNS